ncbi:IS110 family transposase [Terrabacter sp. BE26]|uniref:IS110 family transposase n=1 Tax=Terrabacter sp. BE26 TaxID=2898152 RepID=UPI0035BE444F
MNAIVGIDLADRKQMLVVTDHDSKVLARRTFRCKAWDLGAALDWAADRARAKGFAGVTVACEPTGHRWMVLAQLAAERGMPFVCVQPAASSWARKSEDLTTDKTDDEDAVLIARLTAQLRCYLPEPVDRGNATWTRLRHLGTRREELIGQHVAAVQTARDLLECVWPAALETGKHPFRSATWVAALCVVVGQGRGHDGGDLDRTRRLGPARFERAVRAEVSRRGGIRPCLRIVRRLFAALTDTAGVVAHRPAVFERLEWTLADWDEARAKLADVEARMVSVLDELGLTTLVTSIDGLSPVGAAAILAQTGDLRRFTSARAVVKHAGLAPRERKSGTFTGKARVTGAGRPQLRVAAWRAVWGCLQTNRVYAARYRHLTSRETNRLTPTQAQTAVAAAILRQLYAVVTQQQAWNPVIAAHGTSTWKETTSVTAA